MIIYHVGPYSCAKQPCGISFRSNSTENNILQKQDHNVNSLKVVVIWSKYLDTQSLPCFWFQAWSCQSCWVMYVFWFPLSRMVLARCFSLGCAWEGFDAKAMQVCNKIDVSLSTTYMSVAERGCPLPWGVAELRLVRTCLMLECQWPYTSLDDVAGHSRLELQSFAMWECLRQIKQRPSFLKMSFIFGRSWQQRSLLICDLAYKRYERYKRQFFVSQWPVMHCILLSLYTQSLQASDMVSVLSWLTINKSI